ncbi:DUF3168 domain-containing protein [Chitinasiproducens palmae]|uniref:DUF3168 domain-containing protein n=1 Tax=Chitinasiproducens palmae TaxID=1770053 RepID=UPI002E257D2D
MKALADGRVYPDLAKTRAAVPYIVYQAVGGIDETTLSGADQLQNTRMQITVWAADRATASSLMQQIRNAMTAEPVRAVPIGAPVSEYEDDTKLYGSRLDFSVWWRP